MALFRTKMALPQVILHVDFYWHYNIDSIIIMYIKRISVMRICFMVSFKDCNRTISSSALLDFIRGKC